MKIVLAGMHQTIAKSIRLARFCPSFGLFIQPGLATMPKSLFILAAMSGLPWDGWVLGFWWRVGIVMYVFILAFSFDETNHQ